MGYKRIRSAIHNFAHSFASFMNYVEGEYIIDILGAIVPGLPEAELRIEFPGGRIEPQREYPRPLRESIGYYDLWLPRLLAAEGVAPESVPRVRLVATATRMGLRYRAEAIDDRGKMYAVDLA